MELGVQTSLFNEETKKDKIIEKEILKGPNIEGGKKRIFQLFRVNLTKPERVEKIKKEYGTGGWAGSNEPSVSFCSRGFEIKKSIKGTYEYKTIAFLKWNEVEEIIRKLIVEGRYLKEG